MLITDKFVFVHLPKTGGMFIRKVCADHLLVVETPLGLHAKASEIPSEYADLPVFAVVRNPWDWYVSWHHFQRDITVPHDLWGVFSNEGRFGFELTVLRCCGKSIDSPGWLIEVLQRRDWDYYTYWWWFTFGMKAAMGKVEVSRFEHLREDFVSFLDPHEIEGDALREAVRAVPPENPSERGPYRDYYENGLRDLVGHKARKLISLYGYEF